MKKKDLKKTVEVTTVLNWIAHSPDQKDDKLIRPTTKKQQPKISNGNND